MKYSIKLLSLFINTISYLSPKISAKVQMHFFQKPRTKRVSASQGAFLKKSNNSKAVIKGKKVNFYKWGTYNEKVLLLHGWNSHPGRWRLFTNLILSNNISVIAVDAPGHHKSESKYFSPIEYADYIDYFVNAHQVKMIVAHSVAAYSLLLYYHLKYESRKKLEKIILMAPTNTMRSVIESYFSILKLNQKSKSVFYHSFRKNYDLDIDTMNAENFAKTVRCKNLLVHDANDEILPISGSSKIAVNLKDSEFHKTEGLGHSLIDSGLYHKMISFLLG